MSETPMDSFVVDPTSPERWDREVDLPERRKNWKVTFMHRVEAAIMTGLFKVLEWMGVDRASAFMGSVMKVIGPTILRSVHKRGRANLQLVFPEKSVEEHEDILRSVWENLGRTVGEFAHLDEFDPFAANPRVRIEGLDNLRKPEIDGKPVIYVSGHFANWELMASTVYRAGVRHATVYRAANNPIIDQRIIDFRASVMSRHLIPKGKRGGRALLMAIKQGLSPCMLVDQKLNDGIAAPFLGHPAMTAPATARLALKCETSVVPVSIRREEGAHFVFTAHDPIEFTPSGNMTQDVEDLTTRINDVLGEIIKGQLGQWLWLHRRWPKEATAELEQR